MSSNIFDDYVTKAEKLSLSHMLCEKLSEWDRPKDTHVFKKICIRALGLFTLPFVGLVDFVAHGAMFTGKIGLGIVLLPANFIITLINRKDVHPDLTIKSAFVHLNMGFDGLVNSLTLWVVVSISPTSASGVSGKTFHYKLKIFSEKIKKLEDKLIDAESEKSNLQKKLNANINLNEQQLEAKKKELKAVKIEKDKLNKELKAVKIEKDKLNAENQQLKNDSEKKDHKIDDLEKNIRDLSMKIDQLIQQQQQQQPPPFFTTTTLPHPTISSSSEPPPLDFHHSIPTKQEQTQQALSGSSSGASSSSSPSYSIVFSLEGEQFDLALRKQIELFNQKSDKDHSIELKDQKFVPTHDEKKAIDSEIIKLSSNGQPIPRAISNKRSILKDYIEYVDWKRNDDNGPIVKGAGSSIFDLPEIDSVAESLKQDIYKARDDEDEQLKHLNKLAQYLNYWNRILTDLENINSENRFVDPIEEERRRVAAQEKLYLKEQQLLAELASNYQNEINEIREFIKKFNSLGNILKIRLFNDFRDKITNCNLIFPEGQPVDKGTIFDTINNMMKDISTIINNLEKAVHEKSSFMNNEKFTETIKQVKSLMMTISNMPHFPK